MAVFTPGISPYSYANDNPINYLDYYGLGPIDWWRKVKDFTMTKVLGFQKHGAYVAGNVYFTRNIGNKYKPSFKKVLPHEPTSSNTATSTSRELIDMPYLKPQEAYIPRPDLNITIMPHRPLSHPTPQYRGNPIPQNRNYSFSALINFEYKSNVYDLEATEKTLSDLVKTLIDYPQLEVIICGNAWGDVPNVTNSKDVWDRNSNLNGTPNTLGGLAGARAEAIKKYLEGKGINSSRIRAWRGNVYPDSERGQSTSFELRNP
jgi:hypothetical protein